VESFAAHANAKRKPQGCRITTRRTRATRPTRSVTPPTITRADLSISGGGSGDNSEACESRSKVQIHVTRRSRAMSRSAILTRGTLLDIAYSVFVIKDKPLKR